MRAGDRSFDFHSSQPAHLTPRWVATAHAAHIIQHVADSPNGSVLRLIDANANRAREALRVVEDYARFILDDATLSGELKNIRHGLAEALKPVLDVAMLHRDTPGDVGTANKAAGEMRRESLSEIVIAAGKRLGEALRALEEYCKIFDPSQARLIELLRYRFYDLEQRINASLREGARFVGVRLYVLITESFCSGPWLKTAEAAIAGGADCLQLREKSLENGEFLSRAKQLVDLCRSHNVISVINDRADIALLSGADGVHVGQGDLSVADARRIVGHRAIVGVSTHEMGQAIAARRDGADYIGVGPVFRSRTKPRDILPGLDYAKAAADALRGSSVATVAIAGITAGNVDDVWTTGVDAIAVTSAVVGASDVRAAAAELKAKLQRRGRTFEKARG